MKMLFLLLLMPPLLMSCGMGDRMVLPPLNHPSDDIFLVNNQK